jgi:hypothetical protein
MGLPAEVRLHTFRYLLVKDSEVYIYSNEPEEYVQERYCNKSSAIGAKSVTSILRVNKRAAEEGLEILYGENIFFFHDGGVINEFLTHVKTTTRTGRVIKQNAHKLRKVIIGVSFNMGVLVLWPNRWYTALFLNMVCRYLVHLKQLTLTTYSTDMRRKGVNAQDLRDFCYLDISRPPRILGYGCSGDRIPSSNAEGILAPVAPVARTNRRTKATGG